MARGKVRHYEDDVLVAMLAGRRHTYAEIGQVVGLSGAYVGKVARGRRRPEVLARLRAVRQRILDEARRLGARWSRALLSRHILVGLRDDGGTARKCREFVLDRCCFGRRPRPRRPALPWGLFLAPSPVAGVGQGSAPAAFAGNDPIPTQRRGSGGGRGEPASLKRAGLGGISGKRPYTYPRAGVEGRGSRVGGRGSGGEGRGSRGEGRGRAMRNSGKRPCIYPGARVRVEGRGAGGTGKPGRIAPAGG